MIRRPPRSTLFPYTTLFRSGKADKARYMNMAEGSLEESRYYLILAKDLGYGDTGSLTPLLEEVSRLLNAYASDRKSTRLNSSHGYISYAVFCLKKKKTTVRQPAQPRSIRTRPFSRCRRTARDDRGPTLASPSRTRFRRYQQLRSERAAASRRMP